jgi:simple sugar transport system ATP-binding protein
MNIAVHNLTKTFGELRANDKISLSFAGGQIHGVLGENGAGKSTLMKLLSGFLRPDAGEVLLDGRRARLDSPADALAAGIGMVHQDPLDVAAFSALENFSCGSPRQVMPNRAAARGLLNDLARRLGFSVTPDARVGELTVGQRQQLEIMRLLACGARALILDEPTTGITAAQKLALFAALKRLASAGNTVLFVSHKLDEVAELCNTVSVLRTGRVMQAQLPMPQPQTRLLGMMFGGQEAGFEVRGTVAGGVPFAPQALNPEPRAPVWSLERLALREGPLSLQELTLDIPAGAVIGLAGLDGSGQQLLLRGLAGLLRPAAGRLLLNGRAVGGKPVARFLEAGVQYLPADRLGEGIIGPLSLADHFALQNHAPGVLLNRAGALAATEAAISAYAIKAAPASPLESLSGGNQQRAMLALLAPRCSGILLDQPTRGLDVASARAVWERLLARRAHGAALVFASADFDELLDYSDYVLVFFGGRVSPPIPRASLSSARLAELIGGVGFEALEGTGQRTQDR